MACAEFAANKPVTKAVRSINFIDLPSCLKETIKHYEKHSYYRIPGVG